MTENSELRFAAFDLDGTLIDSANSIVANVLACWSACGFPESDPEEVRRIIGLPWEESVLALLPDAGPTEFEKIRSYHDEVRRGIRNSPPRQEKAFPGAGETLARLAEADVLLGVVTSRSNLQNLEGLLEEQGFGGHFVVLKTAGNGPGKPNPHMLWEAMEEAGVDRDSTVMIGDTTFDMMMAVSAGTPCIGVSWGVHEVHELNAAGADHVVEEFHQIPPLFEALTGG